AAQGHTVTEQWGGKGFTVVPSPNRPNRSNVLEDVDGTDAKNLWAVGHSDVTGLIGALTLAEHWNGTAWKIVPTPNVGTNSTQDELTGVVAIGADDAWAVGTATDYRPGGLPLTLHWDGSHGTRRSHRRASGVAVID